MNGSHRVPTGQRDTQPPMSQTPPFSPPYQPSNPVTSSTPSAGPRHPGYVFKEMKKEIPKRHDPMASLVHFAGSSDPNQGYPINPNSYQRNQSSSSTSSQAWDPNSSGSSIGLNLSASSSSVRSIPPERSPRKWESQGSNDSNENYATSYFSRGQMSPHGKNIFPGDVPAASMQHPMAWSPPPTSGGQYQQPFQNLPQQCVGGGGMVGGGSYQQQFVGSHQTQGYTVQQNPSERTRSSSGPISSELNVDSDAGGLWMGDHRTQKPNSAEHFKLSQHPGQGESQERINDHCLM